MSYTDTLHQVKRYCHDNRQLLIVSEAKTAMKLIHGFQRVSKIPARKQTNFYLVSTKLLSFIGASAAFCAHAKKTVHWQFVRISKFKPRYDNTPLILPALNNDKTSSLLISTTLSIARDFLVSFWLFVTRFQLQGLFRYELPPKIALFRYKRIRYEWGKTVHW